MQFVDNELLRGAAPAPRTVGPSEPPQDRTISEGPWGSLRFEISTPGSGQRPFHPRSRAEKTNSAWPAPRRRSSTLRSKARRVSGLQCCRLETFDLDDNLAAAGRPDTENGRRRPNCGSAPIGRPPNGLPLPARSGVQVRKARAIVTSCCRFVRDADADARRVHAGEPLPFALRAAPRCAPRVASRCLP